MAEKIADYFGQLGFRVDDKGLKEFISKLDAVAKKMQGLAKVASGSSAIKRVADGMKEIGDKAKVAGDAVDKAADKMVRANKKVAQSRSKSLLGQKVTELKSQGSLGDLQNRASLLAMRDKMATMQKTREDRDMLRAQRRAETASREDERRYQNRVSRTYAPKTSKLALYQSDLARTQMAYNAAMVIGDGSAKRYGEAIKKLRREINSLNREQALGKFGMKGFGGFGGLGGFLTPMLGMAAAGGAAGLGYSTVALNDQLVKQQSISAQFQGLYGSAAGGEAGYQKFKDYANLRGVRAGQVAQDYLGFMYSAKTNIGLEGSNKIFENFTDLARVRGTSGERYQRALAALSQMTSKNRIYSEELTQQLSEHLFGSKEIFAEVITGKKGGDAMTELLKRMKSDAGVVTAEWLPKVSEEMARLAKESGVLDKMSNNLDATLARMNNKWGDFIKKMDEAGMSDALARFIVMLTGKLESLTEVMVDTKDTIIGLIEGFTKLFDIITSKEFLLTGLAAAFTAIYLNAKNAAVGIGLLNAAVNLTTLRAAATALWSMAGAFLVMATPVLLALTAFTLLVLVVEDFHAWMNDKDSVFGYWLGESDEFFKTIDNGFKNIREWWDVSMTYLKNGWDGFTAWVGKPFKIAGQWIDDKLESAQNFISQPAVQGGVNLLQPKMATSGGVNYNIGSVSVTANNYEEFSRNVPQKVKR